MRRVRLWLLSMLVFVSCATNRYTHGIPNLVQVRPDVWRSGQPTTIEQWTYLRSLGIRHSIKLDFESEGTDDLANLSGIEVHPVGIEPRTNSDGLIDALVDVFERPAQDRMVEIKRLVNEIGKTQVASGGWLIHCKNGHDRTGMTVGFVRVIVDKWDKKKAYDEMLARGFHPELIGLLREWSAFEAPHAGN